MSEPEAVSENMGHLVERGGGPRCTATLQDGEVRCELIAGHDGMHTSREQGHDAHWLTTVQRVAIAPDGQQIEIGEVQEYHEEATPTLTADLRRDGVAEAIEQLEHPNISVRGWIEAAERMRAQETVEVGMLRDLLAALGWGDHARPESPQSLWDRCLRRVFELAHK